MQLPPVFTVAAPRMCLSVKRLPPPKWRVTRATFRLEQSTRRVCPECEAHNRVKADQCFRCSAAIGTVVSRYVGPTEDDGQAVSSVGPQAMSQAPNNASRKGGAAASALGFLGWVWIVLSTLGAVGIWIAASEEKAMVDRYRYNIYRSADPTWLSEVGGVVGVAMLIQGLTIGLLIVVFARNARAA